MCDNCTARDNSSIPIVHELSASKPAVLLKLEGIQSTIVLRFVASIILAPACSRSNLIAVSKELDHGRYRVCSERKSAQQQNNYSGVTHHISRSTAHRNSPITGGFNKTGKTRSDLVRKF